MRIFKKVLYTDGGPNDKGKIVEYKAIDNKEKPPKEKNGFEKWEKISFKEYLKAKKKITKEFNLFKF